MDISFSKISLPDSGTIVFLVDKSLNLPSGAVDLDKKTGGALAKAIKSSDFKGKFGSFVSILATVGLDLDRIVIVGTGTGESKDKEEKDAEEKEEKIDLQKLINLGGKIQSYLNQNRVKQACISVEDKIDRIPRADIAANIAYGSKLKSYTFDKYFTKKDDDEKPSLESLNFQLENFGMAKDAYAIFEKISDGVFLARDLVSEPPNILHPESYAEKCKDLKKLGVKVEILGEKEMEKLGMGSLLGVGMGSDIESHLVVMQWNGAKKGADQTPVAFVGKGVTFDTGGISIKPSKGMEDMKYDMAGSAAVVGLMAALAGRKANVNAVGVIGLVENMPDGKAQRPSDIVTSMSGQTIEVLNTDAEGRLVLADALWYTQDRFKPKFMVNLATLTGAIVVALADQHAGIFSNNDELIERLLASGKETGEKLWNFPMDKEYDKMIDSKVADVQNIGDGRGAGSITAGKFLERFVNKVPWAHLDIAGMAWAEKELDIIPTGASGYGVRLLDRLVADHYES